MPILLYYLIERTEGKIYKNHLFLGGAIITAWIGDILLLNDSNIYLIGGIFAFLITQTIYLLIFKSNSKGSFISLVKQNPIITSFILIGYSIFTSFAITEINGIIKYAIIFYALIVSSATLLSFFQQNQLSGYNYMKWGMFIFLMSDSLLATNMFFMKFSLSPMFIIGTYGIAQFLITEGVVRSALNT